MKTRLVCLLLFLTSAILYGQEKQDTLKAWKTGGMVTLTFSNVSFYNWSAGGENSNTINSLFSLFANYQKGNASWDNTLDLAYGLIKQGDVSLRKSDDKIDFASKYGRKAFKNFNYSFLLGFKSQIQPGYNYPNDTVKISNFLSPAYIFTSIGLDYRPKDFFSAFISPFTGKTIIVSDQTLANAGAFGVEKAVVDTATNRVITPGKNIRYEFGGFIKIMFKQEVIKNVDLQTKLDLFSNYFEDPQNIDINWEVLIAMKINKFLTTTISTQLIYDDNVRIGIDKDGDGTDDYQAPRTQFKEILGVGLSFKF